jgi:hypothetical protein
MKAIHKWVFVGDMVITFSTAGELNDDEWTNFINDIKNKQVARYLATNIGTIEVNSVQRKKFVDVSKLKPFPVAVVTDERLVRGLVTAISWFGVNVEAFSWKDLQNAIRHLGVDPTAEQDVINAIRKLAQECNMLAEFRSRSGL